LLCLPIQLGTLALLGKTLDVRVPIIAIFIADSSMIARVLYLEMMVSCSGTLGDDYYYNEFFILNSEDVL
jgi:hypothetical protein